MDEKNGYKSEFEFQIFVQRQVWVMGFQELCLLCYETQWFRHSQVGRIAQSLLWQPATHRLKCAHVPDLAKLASQRPHMAR